MPERGFTARNAEIKPADAENSGWIPRDAQVLPRSRPWYERLLLRNAFNRRAYERALDEESDYPVLRGVVEGALDADPGLPLGITAYAKRGIPKVVATAPKSTRLWEALKGAWGDPARAPVRYTMEELPGLLRGSVRNKLRDLPLKDAAEMKDTLTRELRAGGAAGTQPGLRTDLGRRRASVLGPQEREELRQRVRDAGEWLGLGVPVRQRYSTGLVNVAENAKPLNRAGGMDESLRPVIDDALERLARDKQERLLSILTKSRGGRDTAKHRPASMVEREIAQKVGKGVRLARDRDALLWHDALTEGDADKLRWLTEQRRDPFYTKPTYSIRDWNPAGSLTVDDWGRLGGYKGADEMPMFSSRIKRAGR